MPAIVHLALHQQLADWEGAVAVAQINTPEYQREPGRYAVRTVGVTADPITTMGGLRVTPVVTLDALDPADSAMLILPGGPVWDAEGLPELAAAAGRWLDAGVPVAAICGATGGLARAGLLDTRRHTSNDPQYLVATGYAGADRYVDAPATTDGGLITASGVHPVAFAREIFAALNLYEPDVLEAWHALFATGDPAWFWRLNAATA